MSEQRFSPAPDLRTVPAYEPAAVEEYLAAAQAERERLRSRVADAHARLAEVRAGAESPDEMATMVRTAEQARAQLRIDGEQQARAILHEAELEAQRIIAAAREEVADQHVDLTDDDNEDNDDEPAAAELDADRRREVREQHWASRFDQLHAAY